MSSPSSKPRLKKCGPGNWVCACSALARHGSNFKDAYRRWAAASLRAGLHQSDALLPTQTKAAQGPSKQRGRPKKVIAKSAPTHAFDVVADSGKTENPAPAAAPNPARANHPQKPMGKTMTSAPPKFAPLQRPQYQPTLALRLNQRRAVAMQPGFLSIATTDRSKAR